MSAKSLAAALDGARSVTYCPDGLVLAWHGGHALRVFDLAGREVDVRSIGDFAKHEASYAEIVAAARAYLSEGDPDGDGGNDV